FVAIEVEELQGVVLGLQPSDGGELPGLAGVAPETAAAPAPPAGVPKEEPVADLVLGAAHREIEEVVGASHRLAGAPPDEEILDLEVGGVLPDDGGGRREGALAHRAQLAVDLAASHGELARDGR